MKKDIWKFLARKALQLHNLSYRLSTKFAMKAEGEEHPKHRLMKYHYFFVENVNSDDKVLDLGCGKGELTYDLAQKAERVVGIDLNEESIRKAREEYNDSNIEYKVQDVTKELPEEEFDVIVLSNVLEHIEDRISFLGTIKGVAPQILIRVPMINRSWITLYKKELGVKWKSDPTHYIEYTVDKFKKEMKESDLKIQNYSIQFGEIWAVLFSSSTFGNESSEI